MSKKKVLVVGSFVLDQTAITSVFPNEGETVLGETFSKAPGGKGANQAVQLGRLGADTTMIGKLGRDANGEDLIGACSSAGVDTSKVLYDDKVASGCAVIIVQRYEGEASRNRILVIPGTNMTIKEEELKFLEDEIEDYSLVVLQLEIPMAINEYVARIAYEHSVPVLLNPAPWDTLSPELLSHLTFIAPNEYEAKGLTGIEIAHHGEEYDEAAAQAAADALHAKGVKNVLITLGTAGAFLSTPERSYHSPCIMEIKAVDPTAAGDSFIGAFSYGYINGWDYESILVFANHVSALTVSRMGAMPSIPAYAEVVELLKKRNVKLEVEL